MKTIGVSLWDGQARGCSNLRTMVRSPARPCAGLRELFVGAYAKFQAACRAVDEPGLAIIAVDEATGRAAGIAKLCARVQRPVAAIVGRHDQCDLFLAGSDRLALRQLAIVLDPVGSWVPGAAVGYRVLDLKTQDGMLDEDGRTLRGLRAEGPAILRVGGYAIFMLVLGDPTDWPADASDAWQMLPERVYFDELERLPDASLPRMRKLSFPRAEGSGPPSVVMRTLGPRDAGSSLVGGGLGEADIAGTLEIIGPHRRTSLTVGHEALRDGLLLGRYQRCDAVDPDDASLSRVHALLLHERDRLLMIDTASYNGTRIVGEENARLVVIDRDLELVLGKKTRARWRWAAT